MGSEKKKVFIIDDHPVIRQGLVRLLDAQADLEICGDAEDATTAIRMIANLNPDLIITDLNLGGSFTGIDLIKSIRSRFGRMPILVLSMYEDLHYAERSIRAGAMGYVTKDEKSDVLLKAIHTILEGDIYLSNAISPKLLSRLLHGPTEDQQERPQDILSDRELEIFRLIGLGHTTREIAEMISISVSTVESYRTRIKEKLKLTRKTDLIRSAVSWATREQRTSQP